MRIQTLIASVTLLVAGTAGPAQTPQIQKQIEDKLDKLRKEEAKKDQESLETLLAQALKNNPDIRVAESKLHEAEAELYRARISVLNRIVRSQQELKGARAEVENATRMYERILDIASKGAISEAEVRHEMSKLQKAKTELARVQAEMDLLVGKHTEKAADFLRVFAGGGQRVVIPQDDPFFPPAQALIHGAPVQGNMADKIRKALDTPHKVRESGKIDGDHFLLVLRDAAPGVNIQATVKNLSTPADLQLSQAVPLGALFEWAEDHFGWRFVIRDYGIVATDRANVPPGAMPLLEFWRNKGAPQAAP
jgi:hypothetical protein